MSIFEFDKNNLHGLLICIHNFLTFPSITSNEKASSTSFGLLESIIKVFKLVKSLKYKKLFK